MENAPVPSPTPRRARRRTCGECGSKSHDVRTCPKVKQAKHVEKVLARADRKRRAAASNGDGWLQEVRARLDELDALKRALASAGFYPRA